MNRPACKQARKIFAALLLLATPVLADPSGPEIIEGVRHLVQAQTAEVTGRLRTGAAIVPFSLRQADGESVYQFTAPDETIRVRFADDAVTLTGVADSSKPVRGSILSYDDLALRFLYWKDVQIVGQEKIRGLPCWQLRLAPPDRQARYGVVRLWVNRQSGAFLRADAFDWNGDKVRRFEVISTQSIDDRLMLKQMRVQDLKPAKPDAETLTYLEIDGKK